MNLINAKVYYDGSHWIAIPHTERAFRRRRRTVENKDNSKTVEQFEKAFNKTPKGKKAKKLKSLCTSSMQRFPHSLNMVGFKIVHYHDIARIEGWYQNLF